jgi:hypothetical protein
MAGHFGLGNTNSLASIDVAGAFIVSLTNTSSGSFSPFHSYLTK